VKIILERDDTVDDSIGMWHKTFSEKNGGEEQPAFELLSGLESVRVVRVEGANKRAPDPDKVRVQKVKGYMSRGVDTFESRATSYQYNVDYYEKIKNNPDSKSWTSDDLNRRIAESTVKRDWCRTAVAAAKTVDVSNKEFIESFRELVKGVTGFGRTESINLWYSMIDAFREGRTRLDLPSSPEVMRYGKELGFIDYNGEITPRGFAAFVVQIDTSRTVLSNWAYDVSAPSSQRLVLHCVAGRGKKSVQGGSEESPDNVAKSYRRARW
jgi:hypothetical protein